MIGLVACWILVGRQQASQFDRLFPRPTGNNALEDYVQAGDLLSAGKFGLYQSWQPPERRPSPEELRQQAEANKKALEGLDAQARKLVEASDPDSTPDEVSLTNHLNTLSFVQVKQEELKQFEAALDLMANGNRKPVAFQPGPDLNIGWLSSVRQLGKFSSDAAYAEFAAGNPDRATTILSEELIMAHRVGAGSMIGQLSGIGSTSIALNRFNEQMGALSLPETKVVANLAGQLLDDVGVLRQMSRNDALNQQAAMSRFTDPERRARKGETSPYTPDQMAFIRQQLGEIYATQAATGAALYGRPEDEWLAGADPVRPQDLGVPDNPTPDQLIQFIRNLGSQTVSHQGILAILRDRAQLRLLRLHALIRGYRWVNGSFPESLEAMKLPRDDTYDPLSQKSFQYDLHDGTYRVYSAGVPETGRIELRYRPPIGAAAEPDGPVPP